MIQYFFFHLQPQTPTKLVEDLTEIIKQEHDDYSYRSPSDFSVSIWNFFFVKTNIKFTKITNLIILFYVQNAIFIVLEFGDAFHFSIIEIRF